MTERILFHPVTDKFLNICNVDFDGRVNRQKDLVGHEWKALQFKKKFVTPLLTHS